MANTATILGARRANIGIVLAVAVAGLSYVLYDDLTSSGQHRRQHCEIATSFSDALAAASAAPAVTLWNVPFGDPGSGSSQPLTN
jgi:hypothetical protein